MKPKIRFSALDALVIAVIAVAVLVLVWFFSGREPAGDPVWVNFTFEARNVWHDFQGPEIGTNIYDSIRGDFLGVVQGVEFLPAVIYTVDVEAGEFVRVVVPDRKDVRISIRAPGVADEDRILILGDNVEMRVGMWMTVRGKGYAAEGFCIEIRLSER